MNKTRPQGAISKYLLYGQQNAVPLQQLVKLSGLDNRTTRRMIEAERRTGTPICSGLLFGRGRGGAGAVCSLHAAQGGGDMENGAGAG